MFKKVLIGFMVALTCIIGSQFAEVSNAEAADYYVCSTTYDDKYISGAKSYKKDGNYYVYVKTVIKSNGYTSTVGLKFFEDPTGDTNDWYYMLHEPKGDKVFDVNSPDTDYWVKFALDWAKHHL